MLESNARDPVAVELVETEEIDGVADLRLGSGPLRSSTDGSGLEGALGVISSSVGFLVSGGEGGSGFLRGLPLSPSSSSSSS